VTTYLVTGVGKPVALSAVIPRQEFLESRLYRESARPQGLVDCMQMTIDKKGPALLSLAVSRHKRHGVANQQARHRMQFLALHLRRAVSVAQVMGTTQAQASALAETLDRLRAGMFLVDRSSRIVHANVAGRSMMEEGDGLFTINAGFSSTSRAAIITCRGFLLRLETATSRSAPQASRCRSMRVRGGVTWRMCRR
jgi:hypothetical protein